MNLQITLVLPASFYDGLSVWLAFICNSVGKASAYIGCQPLSSECLGTMIFLPAHGTPLPDLIIASCFFAAMHLRMMVLICACASNLKRRKKNSICSLLYPILFRMQHSLISGRLRAADHCRLILITGNIPGVIIPLLVL